MNTRQWKKRYKRIHGENPPKFYKRAQIRKACGLNSIENLAYKSDLTLSQAFKAAGQAVTVFCNKLSELGRILSEANEQEN